MFVVLCPDLHDLIILIFNEPMAFFKPSWQETYVFHSLLVEDLDDASQYSLMIFFDIIGSIIRLSYFRHWTLAETKLISLIIVFGHILLRQTHQANVVILSAL